MPHGRQPLSTTLIALELASAFAAQSRQEGYRKGAHLTEPKQHLAWSIWLITWKTCKKNKYRTALDWALAQLNQLVICKV